ncbi:hypothetical protein [Saccharopolyspora spinosa]|uniref:SCP-2 sterol transfer family protein n=1 Tax=Saccharopolyspora spinosa TaxID=60894 RepID=A0A2N3XZY9_SACSN|nr:hypothetical protein [Saccharopolyspora spinosa]PKW16227.1 hypothetical protein A8926_4039 [Saccharopolyspora spinosa]
MEFMSVEHVAAMNKLLQDAPDVRSACTQLSRARVVSYLLTGGPNGEEVHWTITFGDTVQFSLEEASSPDARFVGDWTQMIRAVSAGRGGAQVDAGVSIDGDGSVLAGINTTLETARAVATVPVEFPSV